MRNYRFLLLMMILVMLVIGSMPTILSNPNLRPEMTQNQSIAQNQTDLTGVRVGIYEGSIYQNVVRIDESRTALINMFEWMNATVRVFNTTDIINGSLWSCEVLAIPEGLGPILESYLTEEGLQKIREWVAEGGSYIGVRGSAAMAVKDSYFEDVWTEFDLALIDGTSYEVTGLNPEQMVNVTINKECTSPDLSDMPETLSVLFSTGRYILPNEGQELIYIANYTHNNLPAMVASYYGQGTVFISSPHFEYEEDDDRDGTDYKEAYDDPDSEWPFMLAITRWLIDSTPTVCNWTDWPSTPSDSTEYLPMEVILVGSGLGIVVIAIVLVYVRRR